MIKNWPRIILHIDMDAFFASAEQSRNHNLINKPVVITSHKGSPTIIAASYEAKALGFSVGTKYQPIQSVHRLAADPSYYMALSKKIMSRLQQLTTNIEVYSIDEAFLDFSDQLYLYSNVEEIVTTVSNAITEAVELPHSIGAATNKSLAKVASEYNKPNGICIIHPSQTKAFLKSLPIDQFCGIGKRMKLFLNQYNVYVCSEMQNIPISILSNRFGQIGRQIWWMYQNTTIAR